MNVAYSDRAEQTEEHLELLRQATEELEEILGSAQDSVRAQWNQGEDEQGRLLYSLKLSDFSGEVEATFAPEELRRGWHRDLWLARLCGKLLQIRGRKLMEALREPFDPEGDWDAPKPE